jgi:hypothetical protein
MKTLASRRRRMVSPALAAVILSCAWCAYVVAADDNSNALPKPPVAKTVPKTTEINGRTLVDNYFWLRDKPNP